MKLTITAASRREEILQRKADYRARKARNEEVMNEQRRRFEDAQNAVFAPVENAIRTQLGDKIGELYIRVESSYTSGILVEVGNDRGGPRRTPNASLTWSWKAYLDKDGNVKKESSSWSGLEATTMDQIADLKVCVEQLEIINSMDWENLLNVNLPSWRDFFNTEGMEKLEPEPNWDQELMEADLEAAVGGDVAIKAKEGRAWRGDVYYRIVRDSGSQYTVEEVPAYAINDIQRNGSIRSMGHDITSIKQLFDEVGSQSRIRKINFVNMLYRPIDTIEIN